MPQQSLEEAHKASVRDTYFPRYDYVPGRIDFVLTTRTSPVRHLLWGEAKRGVQDVHEMLTQLLLTVKPVYDAGETVPPNWLCVFDKEKFAAVRFHDVLGLLIANDVDWTTRPSNHTADGFIRLMKMVREQVADIRLFRFGDQDAALKDFAKSLADAKSDFGGFEVNCNNFVHIFNTWLKTVRPTIALDDLVWEAFKKEGLLDGDFFLADLFSKEGLTVDLAQTLKIVLKHHKYRIAKQVDLLLMFSEFGFSDGGKRYAEFWSVYRRPPQDKEIDYIMSRRDLLVPTQIREVKGAFFTPQIWVQKAQEYIAAAFGDDWREHYTVWDCAAGTGNLLVGLTNPRQIYASTLDLPDVQVMHQYIRNHESGLLLNNVFQFDFLNDDFTPQSQGGKLPDQLHEIITDPEQRKRLILFINPPYAEAGSQKTIVGDKRHKAGVAESVIHSKYERELGRGMNELAVHFLVRIYKEIPASKICEFSTLKLLQASNFEIMRSWFKPRLLKCFVVPANTFDNVTGAFPIGFKVYDCAEKEETNEYTADIYLSRDEKNEESVFIGTKTIYRPKEGERIIDWLRPFTDRITLKNVGILTLKSAEFSQNRIVFVTNDLSGSLIGKKMYTNITGENFSICCVYYGVRQAIDATWLNDRDQFLAPSGHWVDVSALSRRMVYDYEGDKAFIDDCMIYTVFNNNVSMEQGGNHWIPFTERECGSLRSFRFNTVQKLLEARGIPAALSPEAKAVWDAALAVWQLYHKKSGHPAYHPDAAFYDIRAFFQGRDDKGRMKNTSEDGEYNALIQTLRVAVKELRAAVAPKVFAYGFLKG
ncbi:MAG: hypothetical protein FWE98_04415 [Oscillospiraceae bacterium]|nr:hypothetical protein [Oscillospiraceae bacterium]